MVAYVRWKGEAHGAVEELGLGDCGVYRCKFLSLFVGEGGVEGKGETRWWTRSGMCYRGREKDDQMGLLLFGVSGVTMAFLFFMTLCVDSIS